ncbi:MAG: ATP-binding protein [Ilumatobacteraceae bacterium]
MRTGSREEADTAAAIADGLGVALVLHEARLERGPNLEAAARSARRALLPDDVATGHTLDDQAETVLVNLLRGRGAPVSQPWHRPPRSRSSPCGATRPPRSATQLASPWSSIRRTATPPTCATASATSCCRCAARSLGDVAPLLARAAPLCRDDDDLLRRLSSSIDATDAVAVANEPVALARRALRDWLSVDGYPPPLAAIDRVVEVANGTRVACELPGGDRVARSSQRLRRIAHTGE